MVSLAHNHRANLWHSYRDGRPLVAGVDQREPPAQVQDNGAGDLSDQVVRAPHWGLCFAPTPATQP